MTGETVFVTGMGAIGPGFFDVPEMGTYLRSGGVACAPITRFRTDEFKSRLAFQVDQRRLDRSAATTGDDPSQPLIVRYARRALDQALSSAELRPDRTDPQWIFGTAVAGAWEMEACYGSLDRFVDDCRPRQQPREAVSFTRPAELTFGPHTSRPPVVVTTGCTAGLDALGVAWMLIRDGCGCAVVVGAEAPIGPMVITSFDQITALTSERDHPENASTPFAVQRSGFCIAEGAAALVLESAAHARRRGARPLGIVRGYATTSSAHHMTAIHPSGKPIARSLTDALAAASTDPSDVAVLSPHATSTPQNDLAEHTAFREVFDTLSHIPLFTGKANFGHALGASNLIEVVATILILADGAVPPHPYRRQRTLEFPDLTLPDQHLRFDGRIAAKNSSGFSGIHSAVVLEGAPCT